MPELIERVEDRLADFTRDKRVLTLSWMAVIVGALSAVIAYILVWLIAVITNIAFYRQFSSVFQSPDHHRLGYFVILVPVIGGLMIGLMARYGSEKIRGHGIPEALEAILFGRSRMEPKIAVLNPLSSAMSIGLGQCRPSTQIVMLATSSLGNEVLRSPGVYGTRMILVAFW